jgi:hypothetical protein
MGFPKNWDKLVSAILGASALLHAAPSSALTITPSFDSSVTSLPQASTIEQAFTQAAAAFNVLPSPVNINVGVSWGSVGGQALPSGALGSSMDMLYGYYTLNQVRSWLPSSDVIPSSPASGASNYVLPSAEAKALGLVRASGSSVDGYIGFGLAPSSYSYGRTSTQAGTYNFIGVAEHELDEVLGRISGIGHGFATSFDLFRYTIGANGKPVSNFSAVTGAYFSADGGLTQDGPPFNALSTGDVGDWSGTASATDAQDAFLYRGVTTALSQADFDGLDVLGYATSGTGRTTGSQVAGSTDLSLIPEPASAALLVSGLTGLLLRRRASPGRRWSLNSPRAGGPGRDCAGSSPC